MSMKIKNISQRKRRHVRLRKKISGTGQRLRVSVRRSLKNMFVQLIDDTSGSTLLSVSTLDKDFKDKAKYGGNVKAAEVVAEILVQKIKEKKIENIVFDRGGYAYHGRVKALADVLRKGGLKF